MKSGGLDPSRLAQTSPYGAGGPGIVSGTHRHSWVEVTARGSVVDIASAQDVDSVSSSPGIQRVSYVYSARHKIIWATKQSNETRK